MNIFNFLHRIIIFCYRVIAIPYYKARKGFSPIGYDMWEMGRAFSARTYEWILAFKKHKRTGYPVFDMNLSQKEATRHWEKELDDMIEGWRVLKDWDSIEIKIMKKHMDKCRKRMIKEGTYKRKKIIGNKIVGGVKFNQQEKKAWQDEVNKVYTEAQRKAMKLVKNIENLWD